MLEAGLDSTCVEVTLELRRRPIVGDAHYTALLRDISLSFCCQLYRAFAVFRGRVPPLCRHQHHTLPSTFNAITLM
jgi:hypothetical protein